MQDSERQALMALTLTRGMGPVRIRRCLEVFGTASAVLGASAHDLARIQGIPAATATQIHRDLSAVTSDGILDREQALMEEHAACVVTLDDPHYPRLLKLTPDPPPLLYVRGELREDDNVALGVVGSRKCSHYGREQADRLSAACAQAGLCIVSGGAYGIDAAAHRAAIRAGGRTIAVIGSGLAKPYPGVHAELFDQIAAGYGAVISELPMLAAPRPENFPLRNRIISGLSLGVLVVEAAVRSGALITARLCAEDHGRDVMALPGRVDSPGSAGCHRMIREGWATLVTSAADILDALGDTGQLLKANVADEGSPTATSSPLEQQLSQSQQAILAALDDARTLDQIAAATALPISSLQADLTLLQIRSFVAREGPRFTRRRR